MIVPPAIFFLSRSCFRTEMASSSCCKNSDAPAAAEIVQCLTTDVCLLTLNVLIIASVERAIMQMHATCYVQKDLCLEIRPCHEAMSKKIKELEHETVLRIPALLEGLRAVEKASIDTAGRKGGNIWEYSYKL